MTQDLSSAAPLPAAAAGREFVPGGEATGADADTLFTTLYADLRRLAQREIWRRGAHELISKTTLVHDLWLQLNQRGPVRFRDPQRFLAYATRAMRGLIIDRIRARDAGKRGGGMAITSLDGAHADQVAAPEPLQKISDALDELEQIEPDLARLVDLKFFCGFTFGEVAAMQGTTERTVQRMWRRARLMLFQTLREA